MTIDAIIHECEHLSDEFDYENMNGNMAYSTYSDFKDSISKIQKWLEENRGYQRHEAWNDGYKQGRADEKRMKTKLKTCVWCEHHNSNYHNGMHYVFYCDYCGRKLDGKNEVWFPDCDSAVKTSMGLCNGYCRSDNDDEPIDQCKACKKYVNYDEQEV